MCSRKQLFRSCGKAQIPRPPLWQDSVSLLGVNAEQTHRKKKPVQEMIASAGLNSATPAWLSFHLAYASVLLQTLEDRTITYLGSDCGDLSCCHISCFPVKWEKKHWILSGVIYIRQSICELSSRSAFYLLLEPNRPKCQIIFTAMRTAPSFSSPHAWTASNAQPRCFGKRQSGL